MTAASEAAGALGWAGMIVPAVEYADALIDVVARIDETELERRSRPRSNPRPGPLRALMELPAGIEIPLDTLRPDDVLALQIDGDGLVEWTKRGVRRTYEPACELVGVLANGPRLRQAVDDVSAFSGYTLRAAHGTLRQCAALRDPHGAIRGGVGRNWRTGPHRRGCTRTPGHPPVAVAVAVLRVGLRAVGRRPQRAGCHTLRNRGTARSAERRSMNSLHSSIAVRHIRCQPAARWWASYPSNSSSSRRHVAAVCWSASSAKPGSR